MRASRIAGLIAAWTLASGAPAQSPGWQHSPLPGEGDRAAMGCDQTSTPERFLCVVVRCEDDFSVGLYVHVDEPALASLGWTLDVDKQSFGIARRIAAPAAPYAARADGDIAPVLDALRHGAMAYVDIGTRPRPRSGAISLSGSSNAIGQALYFCAPRQ